MDLVHELLAQWLYRGWLFNYQPCNDLLKLFIVVVIKLFIVTRPPYWKPHFFMDLVHELLAQWLYRGWLSNYQVYNDLLMDLVHGLLMM